MKKDEPVVKTEEKETPPKKKVNVYISVKKPYNVLPKKSVPMLVSRSAPNKKAPIHKYLGSGAHNRTSPIQIVEEFLDGENEKWGKDNTEGWIKLSLCDRSS